TTLTVGPPTGHLAPELYDSEGIHAEAASEFTDPWSLAVALHRILIGAHPFHMLSDLAPARVDDLLAGDGWPARGEHETDVAALPPDVADLMARVFRDGWAHP